MSNPAIVLMTDPTRCSLGDVQHLLQALLEMQHMGEHARPQAFCDHPAAAEGFIAAYAEAYPKLVLQDGAIPTPDYLQSLIAQGQMGAFGQPLQAAPSDGHPMAEGPQRSFEQASSISVPIVVLTLGTSQVLADAMQQSPAMRDSIRLIDIAPEGVERAPASIAEAVAGLDSERAWDSEGLDARRAELDEVAGASIADPGDLTLDRDTMDLDVVETAEATGAEASAYYEQAEEEAAAAEPKAVVAAEPAEPTVAPQTQAAEEAFEASPTAEPVIPSADAVWTANAELATPLAPEDEADDLVLEAEDEPGDAGDRGQAQDPKGDDDAEDQPAADGGKTDGDLQAVLERGMLGDGDVAYPPVGSLIAAADVHYPALEQAAAQSALQELAAVMMDDAIFDADLVSPAARAEPEDLLPGRAPAQEVSTRHDGHVVTIEDLYDALDDESEDVFADSGVAKPTHDTDL